MSSPSIAAVAIAKNEAERLVAWSTPLVVADRIFLLDTGSTDNTVVAANALGILVGNFWSNDGFRFDHARNNVLDRMRGKFDYVFWVDLDETVEPEWRVYFDAAVEKYGRQEVFSTTRVWGNLAYERPTIHRATEDWTWRRPVHEELVFKDGQEYSPAPTGILVHHDQDPTKDRSQYLPLMKIAVDQDPEDTQIAFWYARELMYHGDHTGALAAFRVFCSMDNAWVIERMQAHLHMAEIYDHVSPGSVMTRRAIEAAIAIAPWRREPLLAMAGYYKRRMKTGFISDEAQDFARRAMSIPHTMRPQDYLSAEETWDDERIRQEYHIV